MRQLALACLAAIAAGTARAAAEDGEPSFLGRGLGGLFGGGGPDGGPGGSYASPSAIPGDLRPSSGDFGVRLHRPLDRLNPIALPDIGGPDPAPGIELPSLPSYAPQSLSMPGLIRKRRTLLLEARLTPDGESVPAGLVWRLFSPIPGPDGKLPLVAVARGGAAEFEIPPGGYLLHVGFGRAGLTKRVDFGGQQTREIVVLGAGGLKLEAVAARDTPIPPDKLRFDVYGEAPSDRDRPLIADDVAPGAVVQLNAGIYHIVSTFGAENAESRADVAVEPGRITEATLQHRAAQLTMKLVREAGGEAIADTAWSISTTSGDLVRESVGAFSTMVLEEGDYVILARNKDRVYQRAYHVEAGVNTDVEVLTSDLLATPTSEGSGD